MHTDRKEEKEETSPENDEQLKKKANNDISTVFVSRKVQKKMNKSNI